MTFFCTFAGITHLYTCMSLQVRVVPAYGMRQTIHAKFLYSLYASLLSISLCKKDRHRSHVFSLHHHRLFDAKHVESCHFNLLFQILIRVFTFRRVVDEFCFSFGYPLLPDQLCYGVIDMIKCLFIDFFHVFSWCDFSTKTG